MSNTMRTVVSACIDCGHAQQLRRIADRNASTVSRTVARIVAEGLDNEKRQADAVRRERAL